MAVIRVGKQGRVVLPAGIRRELDIKEGDQLGVIVDEEGRVVMESPEAALKKIRAKLKEVAGDRSLVDELIAERRREFEKEEREMQDASGSP